MPAASRSIPTTSTGRGPKRVVSACATPATITTVPAVARNVTPVFSAE